MTRKNMQIPKAYWLATVGMLLLVCGELLAIGAMDWTAAIIESLLNSIETKDSGMMLVTAFSYVAKYLLIFFLIYFGAYVFATSICWKLGTGVFAFAFMLLTTMAMLAFQEIYHEHFSFAAHFLTMGMILLLHVYIPKQKYYYGIFSVLVVLLLIAVQWLQLIPMFTPLGFGSDDIAAAIKMADGYFNDYSLLNTLCMIFFIVFVILTAIFAFLVILQDKQMHTRKKFEVQGAALRETRHALAESKVYEEIANLVHDLKTPLVTVEGLVSLIEMKMQADPNSPSAKYFQRIGQSVDKMKDMISEILHEQAKKAMEVEELLRYVTSHLQLDEQLVDLHVRIAEDIPPILINKIRFSRAISNVLENAIHSFRGKPGRIAIGVAMEGDAVVFRIRDNGPGIMPVDLEAIFEEGFSTKASSGLGLSFVKRVVESHDGHIQVQSVPKSYTEVRIAVPAARDARSQELSEKQQVLGGKS
ncbi:HAMP domain-containing sensor histidine kinase [Virgibacillus sp. 179-BFC.A HS]|uniref:histidine kinase n=1 Tax=Tigheibacillus jepli TaxID=3035914 RepID=A0ABU5CGT5_9BACI|nr:HAMP domain-containing sensor histidine kinase [Virgibacillus sp. 179-BFC.A HS]MDY0404755.1 HAMP domain-containing sensor histidine kinase [Virgibacillus sp. 179-BFC.A HS]